MDREIGRIAGLWRYPVKSMAAEPLGEILVSWHGFSGDRRWAFIRDGMVRSGFSWLTIRQRNDMWHYQPYLVDPARPDTSMVLVRTPSGEVYDVTDPVLAAELGSGVRVMKQDRGIFDAMPLSVITTRSVGCHNVQRFRPNLLVDTDLAEEDFLGHELCVGDVRTRVARRDERCVLVNLHPVTARRDPSLLRALARQP